MNKWLELLLGLVFVIGPIYFAWALIPSWGIAAIEFLKGGLIWIFVLIGALFVMLGISDLKE